MSMVWVGVGTAVVGAYGASQQAGAAREAGQLGANAATASNQTQLAMFNQQRADQLPAMINGQRAQNEFMRLLGFDMSLPTQSPEALQQYLAANPDVANDPYWGQHGWEHYTQHGQAEGRTWGSPQQGGSGGGGMSQQGMQDAFARFRATPGYQFGLDQGFKTIQSSAAARSGLNSGATLKALQKFGNDYADQQGFTPYMNRLASVAGMGQTATGQVGGAAQNYANQFGQNMDNAAQARASGIVGASNAWSDYAGQMSNLAGQYFGRRR